GGLFGIFNRGVFPDFAYWTKSSEVLIMTLLGGMGSFWGPAVGALVLLVLNQQITSYTEYWPFVLGTVLIVILFAFPGGIVGALAAGATRLRMRRAWGARRSQGGRRLPGLGRRHARRDPWPDRGDHRAQRGRQDDVLQSGDGPSPPGRGRRDPERARHHGARPARRLPPGHGPLVPAHQHLPQADRLRERAGRV